MKLLTEKKVSIYSFIIAAYFLLIYFFYENQIDFVLLGIFRELLTIPFLIAQLVFLYIGIRFLIQKKIYVFTLLGVIVLIISSIFTFSTFFT